MERPLVTTSLCFHNTSGSPGVPVDQHGSPRTFPADKFKQHPSEFKYRFYRLIVAYFFNFYYQIFSMLFIDNIEAWSGETHTSPYYIVGKV